MTHEGSRTHRGVQRTQPGWPWRAIYTAACLASACILFAAACGTNGSDDLQVSAQDSTAADSDVSDTTTGGDAASTQEAGSDQPAPAPASSGQVGIQDLPVQLQAIVNSLSPEVRAAVLANYADFSEQDLAEVAAEFDAMTSDELAATQAQIVEYYEGSNSSASTQQGSGDFSGYISSGVGSLSLSLEGGRMLDLQGECSLYQDDREWAFDMNTEDFSFEFSTTAEGSELFFMADGVQGLEILETTNEGTDWAATGLFRIFADGGTLPDPIMGTFTGSCVEA